MTSLNLYDIPYILQCLIYRFAVRMTTPKQWATYYVIPILVHLYDYGQMQFFHFSDTTSLMTHDTLTEKCSMQ